MPKRYDGRIAGQEISHEPTAAPRPRCRLHRDRRLLLAYPYPLPDLQTVRRRRTSTILGRGARRRRRRRRQITNADRGAGRITGTKAGAAVTIDLRPQADNTLQVIFSAPDSKETNPTLNDRWLAVYNQRMGR